MTFPFALKAGVDPTGVTQELLYGLSVAQSVYASFGQPFTVTSLTEGQHVTNSKHYIGQAADLRTNGLDPTVVPQIARALQAQLGPQYYVLLEGDHIHMQFNGIGTAPGDGSAPQPPDSGPTAPTGDSGAPTGDVFGPTDDSGGSGVSQASVVDPNAIIVGLLIGLGLLWLMDNDFF